MVVRGTAGVSKQMLLKTVCFIVFIGCSTLMFSQTPGVPYQAYILNNDKGNVPGPNLDIPLANTDIRLRFEFRNHIGRVEYTEEISVKTDMLGLVSTVVGVGRGKVTYGAFDAIQWDGKRKRMYIDIDFTNTGHQFQDHGHLDLIYIPGPSPSDSVTHGMGAPTATQPSTPSTGMVYVDQSTGELYVYSGTAWIKSSGTVRAENGLVVHNGAVQLGGTLTQSTTLTTTATNTLAFEGLETADLTTNNYEQVVVDKNTGVLHKAKIISKGKQEIAEITANDGDSQFSTPQTILELDNIDVYRNGVRVDFVQVNANTIALDGISCYSGDEIRIVQLQ